MNLAGRENGYAARREKNKSVYLIGNTSDTRYSKWYLSDGDDRMSFSSSDGSLIRSRLEAELNEMV